MGIFFLGGESPLQAGWNLYLVYQNGFAFRDAYEQYKFVSNHDGYGWPSWTPYLPADKASTRPPEHEVSGYGVRGSPLGFA